MVKASRVRGRVERASGVRVRGEKGLKGGKFRNISRLPYWSAN